MLSRHYGTSDKLLKKQVERLYMRWGGNQLSSEHLVRGLVGELDSDSTLLECFFFGREHIVYL